jgi:hypothetical protein
MSDVEIDLDALSDEGQAMVAALLEQKVKDPRAALSRKQCMELANHGLSKQIELEQTHEYQAFNDGGLKRILKDSVYDRMIRQVAATHPADVPPAKIREPTTRFTKARRKPTEAELEGLRKGNARRHEEAQARREGKSTAEV